MTAGAALARRLEAGRGAFNRGAFYEAHELWEDVWRDLAAEERVGVQGLIQIAAGLHHLQQGRTRPAAALLRKGLQKLPAELYLPLATLAQQVEQVLAALQTGETPALAMLKL